MMKLYTLYARPEELFGFDDILKIPEFAYDYAIEKEQRVTEAELTILKDIELSYLYAMHIIKGRWPEAERRIMKYPKYAYYYAKHVIEGRWPEAEPYIRRRDFYWQRYIDFFGIEE